MYTSKAEKRALFIAALLAVAVIYTAPFYEDTQGDNNDTFDATTENSIPCD